METRKNKKIIKHLTLLVQMIIITALPFVVYYSSNNFLQEHQTSKETEINENIFVSDGESQYTLESEELTNKINDIDWKNATDEELTEALNKTDEEEIAKFLETLTKEETEEILSKNTSLSNPRKIGIYTGESVTEDDGKEYSEVKIEKTHDRYYDYLVETYILGKETGKLNIKKADWDGNPGRKGNGHFYFQIRIDGRIDTNLTFILNDISAGNDDLFKNIEAYAGHTVEWNGKTLCQITGTDGSWVSTSLYVEQNTGGNQWEGVVVNGRYTKPAHHYATWELGDTTATAQTAWSQMAGVGGTGRYSTHTADWIDTLDHNHYTYDTIDEVRIQCNSMNCGLDNSRGTYHRTGIIDVKKLTNKLIINPNGGTYGGQTEISKVCEDTTTVYPPTKTGYNFIGWALTNGTGANGSGVLNDTTKVYTYTHCINDGGWQSDDDAYPQVKRNDGYPGKYLNHPATTTLTAVWERSAYNLKVVPNGGTWENSTANRNFTINQGDKRAIPDPTRTGFTFKGWTLSGTGSTLSNRVFTMGSADATLTANWERNNYTLTVNPNGGTWSNQTSNQAFTIAYQGTKTIPLPTRPGYNFTGWSLSGTGSTMSSLTANNATFTMGPASATLTANWSLATHNIAGNVTWIDNNNSRGFRPANVTVTLSRTPTTGAVTAVPSPVQVSGNSNYNFNNVQTYDTPTGNAYTYLVTQNKVPGYKTTINGFNIVNELILPQYTSSMKYTPVDTFQDRFMKNGKVKVNALVTNINDETYPELGLNNGVVTLNVDNAITIDPSTIKIYYTNSEGNRVEVTGVNYTVNGNTIVIDFGEDKISKIKSKMEIELVGTANEIKEYASDVKLTGNLRAYDGENTNFDLGVLTQKSEKFTAEYQMPKANIKVKKIDSITNEIMTGVEFTLSEWNGKEYVPKEIITDTDGDGYYESSYYEWNVTTQGKYKLEETKTEEFYKDNGFSIEFVLDELRTTDYTIDPGYGDVKYKVNYQETPDGLDSQLGVIENEPYKLKVQLHNVDSQTKKEINSNATYRIYEWDNTKNEYARYKSYLTNSNVEIDRREDKTYLINEWMYYTNKNEGKFAIVEETAAYGYYGDYLEDSSDKRIYFINVLDIIIDGKYDEQEIANQGTIQIFNNEDKKVENRRVKAEVNIQIIDRESLKNKGQADATLEGAKYGIYAREQINHADGSTTRYEGEEGVLYKVDELVATTLTDADGRTKIDDLECGKYYLKQLSPSEGYVLDETEYEFDLTYRGQEIEKIIANQVIKVQVKRQGFQMLKLAGSSSEMTPLENAGFKIYLISDLSIVKEGKISKNEDGTYTLHDEFAAKSELLTKKANSNGTYNIDVLINYYYKMKFNSEENPGTFEKGDGVYYPYSLEREIPARYYAYVSTRMTGPEMREQIAEELFSDEDGYIRSPELPYGEYVLIETSVPDNYEPATPFKVTVLNDSRELQKMRYIHDPDFETRLKMYLKDMRTQNRIMKPGAKFVIENVETKELVTYKSPRKVVGTYENPFEVDDDGIYVSPMEIGAGKYVIKELQVPDGYVLKGKEGYSQNGELKEDPKDILEFEIGTNQIYYVDDYLEKNVIVITEQNKEQVATIRVNVKGEHIETIERIDENNVKTVYEEKQLQGVELGLYAREDIYTQDNQGIKRYSKGELVRQGFTNEQGTVYFENVEIGKYYIREIDTIDGFIQNLANIDIEYTYGINREEGEEELEKGSQEWKEKAQNSPVIWYSRDIVKERQKVIVHIDNKDIDGKPIKGTIHGIYASEDIVNSDGEVIIKKDELLKIEETDEEGKSTFDIDLPLGKYYVKEVKKADGYIENEEIKEIDASYNIAEGDTIEITEEFINDYIKVRIIVEDGETGEKIPDIVLRITDPEGNVIIDNIVSTELGNEITKLPVGEYYLEEIEYPQEKGYVQTEKVKFEVENTGEWQEVILIQEYTKITFNVKGPDEEDIPEGKFVIKDEEGNEVGTFTIEEGEDPEIITKLPVGKYTIESTELPEQYKEIVAEFEIKDTPEIQVYPLKAELGVFDLKIQKWASKIILIEEGKEKVKLTQIDPDSEKQEIPKVELNKERIDNAVIKFEYTIKVTNVGEIAGYANEIADTLPDGLELAEGENNNWKKVDGKYVTKELEETLIKPGESAEVKIILKWTNSGMNTGKKDNKAELEKTSNRYGIKEKDEDSKNLSNTDNVSIASVLLSMVTGGKTIKIVITMIIVASSIVALGIILIKRYVI